MMKLLKNGLLLAITGLFIFTACDQTGDELPTGTAPNVTVSVADPQDEYFPGDVIDIVVDFTADAAAVGSVINVETEEFTITLSANGISDNVIDLNAFGVANATEGSFTIPGFEIPEEAENLTLSFTVQMEDEEARTGEGSLDILVSENSVPVNEFSAILLGGQLNTAYGSFFNAVDGEVYNVSRAFDPENTDKNDLVFWYGTTSGYAIGAVDDERAITAFNAEDVNLQNLNPSSLSRFKLLIGDIDFASIEDEADLLNAFNGDGNADLTRVDNLAIGDVFGITLDEGRGGRIGLIEVEDISGTSGSNRQITINVKIQSVDN
ncbi:hypothetical protein QYS48_02690 [Marivirga arenosa]|uniref:Uncharacterized protein n=1 Tax=Marivirga arenosa TaxID=3059076 RepID=A0AA49GG34_9BACT|nr:hypothetical protein [Marivirga sp. ABR2-2]WKK85969.2 hypothetical protein QYS48_02690 [Marivirga sp. ABR2-2]